MEFGAADCSWLETKKEGEFFNSPQKRQRRYRSDKSPEVKQRLPDFTKIPGKMELAQYGAEECFTSVSGCRMRYLRAGTSDASPPLLLIHGLLGYSFSWRFNLSALAQRRTVYAIDLPGVGFSGRSSDLDCSVQATADRLLVFLREQRIKSLDLLGTSHGGGVAMMLAAMARKVADPIDIRKLILVASINPWSRHGSVLTSVLSTRIGARCFRAVSPWFRFAHGLALARMYGDRRRIQPGTIEGYSAPLEIVGTIDHALKIARCLRNDLNEIKAILPQIADIRTLLVWGDRDRAVLPSSALPLKAQFANAELAIIKGAGHLPYEEFPDEFNRIVLAFLDRQ